MTALVYGHSRRDLNLKLADARWTLGEGLPVGAATESLGAYLEYWLMVCRSPAATNQDGHVCARRQVADRHTW